MKGASHAHTPLVPILHSRVGGAGGARADVRGARDRNSHRRRVRSAAREIEFLSREREREREREERLARFMFVSLGRCEKKTA